MPIQKIYTFLYMQSYCELILYALFGNYQYKIFYIGINAAIAVKLTFSDT